jgi:hypothetical protein
LPSPIARISIGSVIATMAGAENASSGTPIIGNAHWIGTLVNVPVTWTAMAPAIRASPSGGTLGVLIARPRRNAATVTPATATSDTVALIIRVT